LYAYLISPMHASMYISWIRNDIKKFLTSLTVNTLNFVMNMITTSHHNKHYKNQVTSRYWIHVF
jgi:hypothetical protein